MFGDVETKRTEPVGRTGIGLGLPTAAATGKSQRASCVWSFNDKTIADTTSGYRVLETSHPPVYYIPPDDIAQQYLQGATGSSWCEFKGHARYWSLDVDGKVVESAAWSYPTPSATFADIAGYLAFYASRVDQCWVDHERVQPQQGDFYGGWITSRIVGPFKGGAGTRGW